MSRHPATCVGSAAWVGALVAACAGLGRAPAPRVYPAEAPSDAERYCAWYGDARDGVLYVGESAFWWASRGDGGERASRPRGDLRRPGPVHIGRFDLARERWLAPFDAGRPGDRAGVWDVLAHANGRVYFTTFFEAAGFVELASGAVRRLPELGPGLNEIARGPGESLLISRYGARDGEGDGSVLQIDLDGRALAEHPLRAPPGYVSAPKTVAWDRLRQEIWVTSDLLPAGAGRVRHDAYVLDAAGREKRRIARPEIQFVAFAADGTGYFAEREEAALWLRISPPDAGTERRVLLDRAFAAGADFAQDVKPTSDGGALLTRWSGAVHEVDASGRARLLRLPRLDREGLYYTAVSAGPGRRRVCATHCAGVQVVCAEIPGVRAPQAKSG